MYPVEGAQNSLVHCDSTLMWLESCLPSTPDTLLTPHTHTHTPITYTSWAIVHSVSTLLYTVQYTIPSYT